METLQSLKLRLHSIGSTKQITKSMQLISTTKVQKALRRMQENRAYFEASQDLLHAVLRFAGECRHPYLHPGPSGSTAVIAISGDRGLCGAYNVNICKETYAEVKKAEDARCIAIGVKVRDYLRRRKREIDRAFKGASEVPSYEDAAEVAKAALDMYDGGTVGRVLLVYTRYESILSLKPTTLQLLPVEFREGDARGDPRLRQMNYEPGVDAVFEGIVPMYVTACIYGAMLEAAVCEQSARITSMDAAVKNCGDMIDRLSLQYNRMRQGGITQELTEIVSGAEALQAAEEE